MTENQGCTSLLRELIGGCTASQGINKRLHSFLGIYRIFNEAV
ncbi:MAG TPA: hypothetical protein VN414_13325 [Methanosarcina sp.]|nr:hypothetical protein [Methanosarcina sp.]